MKTQYDKIIPLIIVCFFIISCNGQNKEENKSVEIDTTYIVGNYLINPKQRTVAVGGMTGGVTWDGYKYTVDPKIDFDTTNLIFIGEHIFIKEHFLFNCDFNTIEILKSNNQLVIFSDKNKIYTYLLGPRSSEIDISKFKKLSKNIYKDVNGDLMFLNSENDLLRIKQSNTIDLNTVEYVTNNYIKDKNGLYKCSLRYTLRNDSTLYGDLQKIYDSKGINYKTKVSKNYFIFGEKIFGSTNFPLELKIDKNKILEIGQDEYSNRSFLTDGKRLYINLGDNFISDDPKMIPHVVNDFFLSGITIKSVFPNHFQFNPKNETDLIFKGINYFSNKNPGMLIQTSKGYYFIPQRRDSKLQEINNVFIYNIDTKKEEVLNPKDLNYLKDNVYTYKNHLFFDGMPVHTTMDIKIIKQLCKGDSKTNFISDGKKLMCIGDRTGYQSRKIDGIEFVIIDEYSINDFSKLKIINPDILIDDKNIYNRDIIIPIQKLGIPVKVYQ
jgi:hypothetical protein